MPHQENNDHNDIITQALDMIRGDSGSAPTEDTNKIVALPIASPEETERIMAEARVTTLERLRPGHADAKAVILDVLRSALAADPEALNGLFNSYVACNDALANHPYVIASEVALGDAQAESTAAIGIIGLLNGFFPLLCGELIAAVYDRNDKLVDFTVYVPQE